MAEQLNLKSTQKAKLSTVGQYEKLGDVAYEGTEEAHRYLRAELPEYAQPFPVFYLAGNHDVSPKGFTVSRFEQLYGPSIFSFEYQQALFIVLRILAEPISNEDSIAFLTRLKSTDLAKYRRIFVFMHIPPPVSHDFIARDFRGHEQLVAVFNEIGVDYVFAGDFHGYARVKLRDTTISFPGGGGARLNEKLGKQFHHALVIRVAKDSVSERFVHVDRDHDVEDFFERAAIIYIWPWIMQNSFVVDCANGILFLILLLVLKPLGATWDHSKAGVNLLLPSGTLACVHRSTAGIMPAQITALLPG